MNYHMYVCLNIHVVYEGDKKSRGGICYDLLGQNIFPHWFLFEAPQKNHHSQLQDSFNKLTQFNSQLLIGSTQGEISSSNADHRLNTVNYY